MEQTKINRQGDLNSQTNCCKSTKIVSRSNLTGIRANQEESDSQLFYLEYHQAKKMGYPINKKKAITGNWTRSQNVTYYNFMLKHKEDFNSEPNRRKNKIFNKLSKGLKRTADQCRSHHQKLQIKFKNDLDAIIEYVWKKIQSQPLEKKQDNRKTRADPTTIEDEKQQFLFKKKTTQLPKTGTRFQATQDQPPQDALVLTFDFSSMMAWSQ